MCGIAGEICPTGGVTGERAHAAQDAMKRRGPDQNGIYMSDKAVLIHTRLCVVDIENGRQPMSCMLSKTWLSELLQRSLLPLSL